MALLVFLLYLMLLVHGSQAAGAVGVVVAIELPVAFFAPEFYHAAFAGGGYEWTVLVVVAAVGREGGKLFFIGGGFSVDGADAAFLLVVVRIGADHVVDVHVQQFAHHVGVRSVGTVEIGADEKAVRVDGVKRGDGLLPFGVELEGCFGDGAAADEKFLQLAGVVRGAVVHVEHRFQGDAHHLRSFLVFSVAGKDDGLGGVAAKLSDEVAQGWADHVLLERCASLLADVLLLGEGLTVYEYGVRPLASAVKVDGACAALAEVGEGVVSVVNKCEHRVLWKMVKLE
ncbi:MAG: hypothetical protein KBT32_11235 [Bacteroidales bacterium]|nr:hypothetical protein [Candidatus Physcocola equi]